MKQQRDSSRAADHTKRKIKGVAEKDRVLQVQGSNAERGGKAQGQEKTKKSRHTTGKRGGREDSVGPKRD